MRMVLRGLVLAALLAGVVLTWRAGSNSKSESEPASQSLATLPASDPTAPAQHVVQAPEPDAPRAKAHATVRILDPEGHPLPNLRVDRIPRPNDWRARLDGWPADSDADLRGATRTSVTDSAGVAEIPELDESTAWDGSLIWTRAPGKRVAWLAVPGPESPGEGQKELRVSSSVDVEVTVLGADGQPVAGAVVMERADFSDWPAISAEERDARQFEFLPRVTAETDALGVTHLPVLPVRAWIQATADSRTSAAWTGIGAHHVVLHLTASCEVEGRVVDESGVGTSVQGAVSCQLRHGYDASFITLVPVRAGGAFGPVRLPLASEDGFIFQYFGGELEAAQAILAAPQPGSRSSIEIRTRAGQGVALFVTDEEGHPLANVSVATQWLRNNAWSRIDRRTQADGRARLANLPTGEVWVKMRKPGYVPEVRQLFRSEQWANYPLDVKMGRAATVEGRCTSSGRPTQKFTVYFWQEELSDGGKVEVEDSEDGSFRIEEAAPGLVQLFATSPEVVQTAPAGINVEAGTVGNVQLEFSEPRTVRGRVFDALSGEPIPGARVSVMLLAGVGSYKPWKAARAADKQGVFEVSGLGATEGSLSITAEGFTKRAVSVPSGKETPRDLGRIGMHRSQSLLVRLHSSDPIDFSTYGLTLASDTGSWPGVRFPADGTLRFEDLGPGIVQLTLEAGNGDTDYRQLRMRPAGNNTYDFDLDGEPLDIDVVPTSGSTIPELAALGVQFVDPYGLQVDRAYALPRSGAVHLDKIRAQRVLLCVTTEDQLSLGSGEYDVPATSPRAITFVLSPRPVRLRAVNEAHAPIVGASLILSADRGGIDWKRLYTTDASGEALVQDLGSGTTFVSAFHIEHGDVPCSPLSAGNARGDAIEITIPHGKEAGLELRDGAELLPGVECELKDSCGSSMTYGRLLAGEDGRVHFAHLAPGDYRVLVDHPGIWRTEQPITVSATSTSFTVQLRRLGSARVRVRTGAGTPVAGASIDLVDVATGARVADWIRQGEVLEPAGGLLTDASGTLVIHGLPRGSYRCVLSAPSGAALERTLDVPPQATGELEAVVQ